MSTQGSGGLERSAVRGAAIGDTLGRCLLTELLGRGGGCTVFRALHQGLNVPVAVKVFILDTGEAHRRAYEQLRGEARLLAQIDHPHVVRVLDFEDDAAFPYLVLECVEGPSLADLIRQSGRLSLERATEVIDQAADALAAVWALGAVHRDVKPGNLLLTRGGTAKLADFGQAMLIEDHELRAFEMAPPTADQVAGTAAYLAPEQFLAPASVDHRADIYALGSTLYQAVTGQTAFTGRSRLEVMHKHAKEPPRPPHELVPELGPATSEVILTMLAKDPGDRYQSAAEVRGALARLMRKDEPAVAAMRVRVEDSAQADEPPASETSDNMLTSPRGRASRSLWRSFLGLSRPAPRVAAGQNEYMRILKRSLAGPGRRTG